VPSSQWRRLKSAPTSPVPEATTRLAEVPLAGRVSMDLITADVTNVDNAQIGDEIELWGNEVRIERIAEFNGMSAYELLARIPKRLPRVRI